MASEARPGSEGTPEDLSQHPFVEKLMPDPAEPASPTVQFEGLLGKSTRGDHYWRLYLDRELSEYVEFNKDDVLNSESIAKEQSSMGLESTKLWLKRDATITRAHSRRVQAEAAETVVYGKYASLPVPGAVPGPSGNLHGERYQPAVFPKDPFPEDQIVPDAQKSIHIVPDYSGQFLGQARVAEASGGVFQIGNTGRISMRIYQSGVQAGSLADVIIYLDYRGLYWNLPPFQDVVDRASTEVYGPLDFWTHPRNMVTGDPLPGLANHWVVTKPSTNDLSFDCRIWHVSGNFNCRIQGTVGRFTSTPWP